MGGWEPNECWEPLMGGWEPKSSPPFWGYAVTQLRGYTYGIV